MFELNQEAGGMAADVAAPVATTETQLSPAELLLRDLSGEVEDTSTAAPSAEENTGAAAATEVPEGFVEAGTPQGQQAPANMATLEDVQQVKTDLLAQILELAKQNVETKNEEAPAGETPPEFSEEDFLDDFSENPATAIKALAESIADQKTKAQFQSLQEQLLPLLEQSKAIQYKDKVKGVVGKFLGEKGDAKDLLQDIAEYIKSNQLPADDERSYYDAYRESKLKKQEGLIGQLQTNQGKSLEDYMSDEESIAKMTSNEAIKKKVIEDYLESLQNGGKPTTISSSGTAQPAAQSRTQLKTFKEAGKAFADSL